MYLDTIVARIIAASRSWVDSLPRERLGSLAVDEYLLVLSHAYLYTDPDFRNDEDGVNMRHAGNIILEKRIGVTNKFYKANPLSDEYFSADGYTELFFWWNLSGMHTEVIENNKYRQSEDRPFHDLVFNRPEILPYYEAGLRDVDFIERCISDGVDADMARSLGEVSVNIR